MAISVGTIKVNATLDSGKFTSGLNDMEADADKATQNFGGKFADLAKKALTAGAAAGAALVTGAVKSFSDNQQLVGGVNKLFGSAADGVVKNAQSAFRRTQMSANDYLNTVTGFSASLIAGLHGDTAKAAKVADTAVTDMADNANTFGTSMSSIQYAYQGFAKQNYTMLDNLKLGYGGTASEMARLVNDSGVMGKSFKATAKNINDVSFDKIIEAIHITQDRMQIAGTSSKEASGTVEGSFNQMKAAAGNFLTALGTGGDVDQSFQQLSTSVQQFMNNLIPVVQRVVQSIINAVGKIWSDFAQKNPLIAAAIAGIAALIAALVIPQLIAAGVQALATGAEMLAGWLMALGPIGLIVAAIAGVIAVLVVLWNRCEGFRNFILGAISAIGGFFSWLWNGIKQGISAVAYFISNTFTMIVNWIKINVINRVAGFFSGLWNGIKQGVGAVAYSISGTFASIVNWIKINVINRIAGFFSGLWNGVASGLRAIGGGIRSAMWSVVGFIKAPINAIIGGVNAVLSRINSIKVPDWVPKIGGSHTSFGMIPRLATGGYVDGVGTATSDSNLMALSRGEYVVKASTVRDFGVDFFDRLNAGQLPTSAGPATMVTNNYYQFDQQANNRWMYEQIRTGAAA